jgi:hypothetical protein
MNYNEELKRNILVTTTEKYAQANMENVKFEYKQSMTL